MDGASSAEAQPPSTGSQAEDSAFTKPFPGQAAAEASPTPSEAKVTNEDLVGDAPAKEPAAATGAESRGEINWRRHIGLTVVWLLVVCVAAWLVLRFFYAGGGMAGIGMGRRRYIRIVDRQILSPQKSLLVVEVAGRMLVLGVGEQQIQLLTELDASTMDEGSSSKPAGPRPLSAASSAAAASTRTEPSYTEPVSGSTQGGLTSPPPQAPPVSTQQQLSALFGTRQPPGSTP
jgi:flagellar biosynthetic protein FliO